jgi:OOP family OmpA-OmpF porin
MGRAFHHFRKGQTMWKKLSIGLAALLLGATAWAQGYGVVSAGMSRLSADCSGIASCDKTDTAFKLMGGYKFNPNVAVEVGYFDFGKATASDSTQSLSIKTSAFGGGIAYHQDLSSDWNFVARVGLAQVKTKISATLTGYGSASDSDNNVNAYVGLGVGYKLSKATSVDFAWDVTRSKYNKGGLNESGNVSAFSVGLTFAF